MITDALLSRYQFTVERNSKQNQFVVIYFIYDRGYHKRLYENREYRNSSTQRSGWLRFPIASKAESFIFRFNLLTLKFVLPQRFPAILEWKGSTVFADETAEGYQTETFANVCNMYGRPQSTVVHIRAVDR